MSDDRTTEPIVDLLDEEWANVVALGAPLDEAAWKTPVSLPGWTVQDCASHIIGVEASLLGDPIPEADISHLGYLRDPFAEIVEVPVEFRRSWTGGEVLADLEALIPRRIAQLRDMTTEQFDEIGWSPLGQVPYRTFMGVRLFDSWMHEQDMRRALDLPGHLEGPIVEQSLVRFHAAVPFVVGKKAGAPEGATVVFRTTGPTALAWTIRVVDGRAKLVGQSPEDIPADPTVAITLDFASFIALCGGRWSVAEAKAVAPITVDGDRALGDKVLSNLAFTP